MTFKITKQEKERMTYSLKRSLWTLSLVVAGLLVTIVVGAADYNQYTTNELVQVRTQGGDIRYQDREQYRDELRLRSQGMSHEERRSLGLGGIRNLDADENRRLRASEDNDRGRGELVRERSRNEFGLSNYGEGYETRQNRGSSGIGMGRGGQGGGGRGR